jgi:hypothetical protein
MRLSLDLLTVIGTIRYKKPYYEDSDWASMRKEGSLSTDSIANSVRITHITNSPLIAIWFGVTGNLVWCNRCCICADDGAKVWMPAQLHLAGARRSPTLASFLFAMQTSEMRPGCEQDYS